MSGGQYYKVMPDGADFTCKECEKKFPAKKMIVHQNIESGIKTLLCLDCVDEEWLKDATCIGEL